MTMRCVQCEELRLVFRHLVTKYDFRWPTDQDTPKHPSLKIVYSEADLSHRCLQKYMRCLGWVCSNSSDPTNNSTLKESKSWGRLQSTRQTAFYPDSSHVSSNQARPAATGLFVICQRDAPAISHPCEISSLSSIRSHRLSSHSSGRATICGQFTIGTLFHVCYLMSLLGDPR